MYIKDRVLFTTQTHKITEAGEILAIAKEARAENGKNIAPSKLFPNAWQTIKAH